MRRYYIVRRWRREKCQFQGGTGEFCFKTYMKVSTSVSSLGLMEDDSEDAAVNITKIQQMYCRVKEKNTDNTYQYVPVYAFLGKISVSGTEDTNDSIFCLIHAIDGTIINAGLGY